MNESVIKAEELGKKFKIGATRESYRTLRDLIANSIRSPFRRMSQEDIETIWALKGLKFDVNRGEVVGIIGRNGAGKSTLLKILSRITEPTEGYVRIRGKVGSLLEVGTGFHQELTGRENIYLNGAILGMKKAEIDRKFDEIVAFSEIEKFIDTPVKHYSSGMYMRLAFAVAAHLETEILIVDEVLAVGDVSFQRKCIGKMGNVALEGRTILFVSHNMSAVSSLCSKGMVLDKGMMIFNGSINDAIRMYNSEYMTNPSVEWRGNEGDENVRLLHTQVKSLDCNREFHTAAELEIGVEVEVLKEIEGLVLGFTLFSEFGYELAYVLYDDDRLPPADLIKPGKMTKTFVIPANTLAPGTYRIEFDIGIHTKKRIIHEEGSLMFSLENIKGTGRRFFVSNVRGRGSLFRPYNFLRGCLK